MKSLEGQSRPTIHNIQHTEVRRALKLTNDEPEMYMTCL